MGYQALLFCSDEKLSRVVSQVFGELEFAVDPVTEPFAAVKKLMAQHFDAIVVDCENEQNSALLFKSARNSTFNQASLAIALVEGQAGVAKAYRIGANLVLTKPFNVEQAKGMLRVARGLLRKSSDAMPAAGHAPAALPPFSAPASIAPVFQSGERNVAAIAPPTHGLPAEFEDPAPVMTSLAKVEEEPAPPPVQAKEWPSPAPAPIPSTAVFSAKNETEDGPKTAPLTKVEPSKAAAASVLGTGSRSKGAASAPAPAKETPATADNQPESETHSKPLNPATGTAKEVTLSRARDDASSLPFSSYPGTVKKSGGSLKLVIVAAAVLLLAAAAYLGWTKFGQSHQVTTAQLVTKTPEVSTAPSTTSTSAPTSAPVASARTAVSESTFTTAPAAKTSAAHLTQPSTESSTTTRIAIRPGSDGKEPSENPLVVKSPANAGRAQADESSGSLPNPLAVETTGPNAALSGVLSSASSEVAKPTLAQTRISQGVSQGMVIKRIQPKYPQAALATHTEGAVQIEVTVNKEGNVVNPKVLSGDRMLAAAAIDAVRQWRYKPYYLNGEPMEIQTQITINFKAR